MNYFQGNATAQVLIECFVRHPHPTAPDLSRRSIAVSDDSIMIVNGGCSRWSEIIGDFRQLKKAMCAAVGWIDRASALRAPFGCVSRSWRHSLSFVTPIALDNRTEVADFRVNVIWVGQCLCHFIAQQLAVALAHSVKKCLHRRSSESE